MSSPFVLKPCDANFTQAIKYLDVIFNHDDYEGKAIPKAQKPLCGLGLAVKDLFHIQGLPTSAGNPDCHPLDSRKYEQLCSKDASGGCRVQR